VDFSPFQAAVNPRTNTIYVTITGDSALWQISGRTNTVTATVPVGNFPQESRSIPGQATSTSPMQLTTRSRYSAPDRPRSSRVARGVTPSALTQ
jgi:DNA-binding beta-propeller fold protein YncE